MEKVLEMLEKVQEESCWRRQELGNIVDLEAIK